VDGKYTLLKSGDIFQYFEAYGSLGVDALFVGVPDHLVTWWCVWFGECMNTNSEWEDSITAQVRRALDKRVDNCSEQKWYKDGFLGFFCLGFCFFPGCSGFCCRGLTLLSSIAIWTSSRIQCHPFGRVRLLACLESESQQMTRCFHCFEHQPTKPGPENGSPITSASPKKRFHIQTV
jgi:hypothetical protein